MQYLGYYYIFIPSLFITLIAVRRQPGTGQWIISTAPFAVVIVFMWVTGRWEIPSIYLRPVFPVLMVIACIVSFKRIKTPEKPAGKIARIFGNSIKGFVLVMLLVMNIFAFNGYRVPEQTVELASPLRDGMFVILHGGTRPFVNAHAKIRPQNFAIDIVRINDHGMRAKSIVGGKILEDYEILGSPLYAPCDGEIRVSDDGLKDLIPPQTDPDHPAGNHVLISCGDFEVLLAHLRQDSIKVRVGERVTTESFIGQVGNTGNTSEPHLHMHAERGGDSDTILNGDAVPFTIDGRFLIRGDTLDL